MWLLRLRIIRMLPVILPEDYSLIQTMAQERGQPIIMVRIITTTILLRWRYGTIILRLTAPILFLPAPPMGGYSLERGKELRLQPFLVGRNTHQTRYARLR